MHNSIRLSKKASKKRGKTPKKKVSEEIANTDVVTYKVPKITGGKAEARIKNVLVNMAAIRRGSNSRLMLTGNVGSGKTSFVRQMANILGLPLVMIEAPHISEEKSTGYFYD